MAEKQQWTEEQIIAARNEAIKTAKGQLDKQNRRPGFGGDDGHDIDRVQRQITMLAEVLTALSRDNPNFDPVKWLGLSLRDLTDNSRPSKTAVEAEEQKARAAEERVIYESFAQALGILSKVMRYSNPDSAVRSL